MYYINMQLKFIHLELANLKCVRIMPKVYFGSTVNKNFPGKLRIDYIRE